MTPDRRRRDVLRRRVLTWADTALRDLPWRRTRDPWAVLVSEVMLQQTQVARVVQRWPAFLAVFPTAEATALADAAAVVRAWEGLGYNRRAVALHAAAVAVVERHDGALPTERSALEALPGVGPYTARAVQAFAFEADVGVVDVNVARVLSRAVAGRSLGAAEAQQLADRLVPDGAGWTWNQAMLDLGATVCSRRSPRCDACPLRPACVWRRAGDPTDDPAAGGAHAGRPQGRFEGSDRQLRGRIVRILRDGPVADDRIAEAVAGPGRATQDPARDPESDPARLQRLLRDLTADGLVRHHRGVWYLGRDPRRPQSAP